MPFTDSVRMVDVVIANKALLSATPSDVLSGVQFVGSTQHMESGTIPVLPEKNDITIVNGETININFGYNPKAYKVKAVPLSDATYATANPHDILYGKTVWVNGEKLTGEIPIIGEENDTLVAGSTHIISEGYHNGQGKIVAKTLSEQTGASIVAEDLRARSDCWANGIHIQGAMAENGAISKTLYAGESYIVPEGYHNGQGKVSTVSLRSQTNGNATANTIINGYTAWVNGEKITGNIPSNSSEEIVLPMNGEYEIPYGYHTGFGKITQNVPNKDGQTISATKEAQTIEVGGYYMNSDITISGVDALNYQRPNSVVKDSSGNNISNYTLTVSDNKATVVLYVDNWHDNATGNVYKATFSNLVDSNDNSMNLETVLFTDYAGVSNTYRYGNIFISIKLEDDTNAHIIEIIGIKSGKITLTELLSIREFGVDE